MNSTTTPSETLFIALTPSSTSVMNRFATNGRKSGIQAILAVGYFALAVVVNEAAGNTGLLAMGFLLLTGTYVLGRAELMRANKLAMAERQDAAKNDG
ncbi:MAG: hypothetical protein HQL72_05590 [Magnetococcales bacterium]|nr:hypothetical protein [Magnetococcales bacterium]